jgi:hypothetical protein
MKDTAIKFIPLDRDLKETSDPLKKNLDVLEKIKKISFKQKKF